MRELGLIKKIDDLRIIWPHEAHDFSKWLSLEENLSILSDAVGIDIVLEELESPVGGFNADLFAREESSGRKIIIENQLEDTNHDHLGKIITYASGKNAEVIIWIVKRARDEHSQAIEWLNQHTDGNIGFFLVEIELWQINDSLPAPRFNIVERPNDWAKTMKTVEGLSDTQKLKLDYWQAFSDYAFRKSNFSSVFSKRKAQPQHWSDLSLGKSSYHITLTVNTQKKCIGAEIYISDNKEIFEKLKLKQSDMEKDMGRKLEWREASKDCRIFTTHEGDIRKGTSEWTQHFEWMCEMSLKLRELALKYDV